MPIFYINDKEITIPSEKWLRMVNEDGDTGADILSVSSRSGSCSGHRVLTLSFPAAQSIRIADILPNTAVAAALANGWQCWSHSPVLGRTGMLVKESNSNQKTFGDDALVTPKEVEGCFHSWGFTWAFSENEILLFCACLNEDEVYGLWEWDLQKQTLDFAALGGSGERTSLSFILPNQDKISDRTQFGEIGSMYVSELERFAIYPRKSHRSPPKIRGYCSWYRHYTKISNEILQNDLRAVAEEGKTDLFQIDDGYQKWIGDWLQPSAGFAEGDMLALRQKISAAGMQPGLWMAPFVAVEHSDLLRQSPEFLLRDENAEPVLAGDFSHWGGKFYCLDVAQPQVLEHLSSVFDVFFGQWGFEFLKADFLYAAGRTGNRTMSGPERQALGHSWLDQQCRQRGVTLLSCGATLGSAIGRCDYSRVGPDVSLNWGGEDGHHSREKCNSKAALDNAWTRSLLGPSGFGVDPDVVILRRQGHDYDRQQQILQMQTALALGDLLSSSDTAELCDPELRDLFLNSPRGHDLSAQEWWRRS